MKMFKLSSVYLIILITVPLIIAQLNCSKSDKPEKDGKLTVAASILPLADFCRQVGGDRINIEILVPSGASPHTYEPTIKQLKFLSRAKILVLNGLGLEYWSEKIIGSADNKDLTVLVTAEGIKTIDEHAGDKPVDNKKEGHEEAQDNHEEAQDNHEEAEHAFSGHAHEGGINPHVWLDPVYAVHMVEKICSVFCKEDPAGKDFYEENSKKYIADLVKLDNIIRNEVNNFSSKKIIAFHSAYVYFTKRYGLIDTGVIEEIPGKEPSPREIKNIIDIIKKYQIKAIFAEPQFPPKEADLIAAESGAKVLFLDPLGKEPGYSYIKMMENNLDQLRSALK